MLGSSLCVRPGARLIHLAAPVQDEGGAALVLRMLLAEGWAWSGRAAGGRRPEGSEGCRTTWARSKGLKMGKRGSCWQRLLQKPHVEICGDSSDTRV